MHEEVSSDRSLSGGTADRNGGGLRYEIEAMNKTYRSDALASIHETMEALHRVGAIDKQTMRRFDEKCLTTVRPLVRRNIKALRKREGNT